MTNMRDIDEQVNASIHGMTERMSVRTGVKWQLQRTPYESEVDIVSDGRVIATVEAGEDNEEIASLITAAPDMLGALVEVKMRIEEYITTCPLCGESAERGHKYYCLWHVANDAIRKARGEE